MLPITVRQGSSESPWNTKPRSVPGLRTTRPSTVMEPPSLSTSPSRMRSSVVLPHPLGPTMATNSPGSAVKLMS
jgi:hypothetical protein